LKKLATINEKILHPVAQGDITARRKPNGWPAASRWSTPIRLAIQAATQGGAEWRLTEYQPERKETLPDLKAVNATQPDEWEE
jgi:hypothetical protein